VDLGIPNAVSPLTFEADFLRRSLRFSISLNTPQDKVRPTAAVNWVTRQLAPYPGSMDTLVRVHWPGRTADTVAPLAEAIVDPKAVAPDDRKTLPTGFEIQRVVDLAGRFKGSSTFIEDARREIPRFYKDVVQNVANWVPKAPKYKERTSGEVDEGEPKRGVEELAEDRTSPVSATDPEETASTEMGVPDGVALQRE
jgi:hypothetical protein